MAVSDFVEQPSDRRSSLRPHHMAPHNPRWEKLDQPSFTRTVTVENWDYQIKARQPWTDSARIETRSPSQPRSFSR